MKATLATPAGAGVSSTKVKPGARFFGIGLLGVLLAIAATPALSANQKIEGVWKLARPQVLLAPADGSPLPLTDEGRRRYDANKAYAAKGDYESYDMTQARCSSPGAPRLMLTPDRFRIFARHSVVYFMFEWNRVLRQVDLDTRGKLEMPDWGTVTGLNKGHWEKDVLVVESLGFNRKRLLDNLLPNSEELRLLERIRLVDANTLEDRITITDPEIFTKPWDALLTYKRQPDEVFSEDVCLDRKAAGQPPLPTS
jgi:hypothetical protein